MLPAYLNSLYESVGSRMILVLFGVAILIGLTFIGLVHVKDLPDGNKLIFIGTQSRGAPEVGVPAALSAEFQLAGGLWLFLAILAATPLLTSTVEKGWYELELSKATPRWEVLLGRFFGALTLYAVTLMLATFPLAVRLWWVTGVATWPILYALLFESLSFASLLSVAAIAALAQKGTILPNIASIAVLLSSPLLARRQETFYPFISSSGGRMLVDCLYLVLPKCDQINFICGYWIDERILVSWWPLWLTAVFTAVVLSLTLWLLERKSF